LNVLLVGRDAARNRTPASRGFAVSLRRQDDEARREFETAIRLNPKLYEAHYFYARACMQEGKLEEAVRHYKVVQNGFGHREWLENDSTLDSLRGNPRFDSLRKRM
jgi:tetratricopeptide (TPR) repeat protein